MWVGGWVAQVEEPRLPFRPSPPPERYAVTCLSSQQCCPLDTCPPKLLKRLSGTSQTNKTNNVLAFQTPTPHPLHPWSEHSPLPPSANSAGG